MKKHLFPLLTAIFALCAPLKAAATAPDGSKKEVGVFYFVWLGQHPSEQTGNYNITELLSDHPSDLYSTEGTGLSPMKKYHFWAEPLYGYYNSADPWVIARHIELFMAAGVDYLVLDTTNGFAYPKVVAVLLESLKAFQSQGLSVPKVSFYTNGASGRVVRELYDTFYKDGKYDSLWYSPKGKPMIIGVSKANKGTTDQPRPVYIDDSLTEYFDVRESQWPTMPYQHDTFPWMSWDYPQKVHDGVISVSVAQHSTKKIIFSDMENGRGRGYDAPSLTNLHDKVRSGHNIQNQWNSALNRPEEVNNVFLTGWNEWVAIKYVFDGKVGFVDTFNEEFSRDIEMMKGGYGDNFYLQMARNIRNFKGQEAALTAPIKDVPPQWRTSEDETFYMDPEGDARIRSFADFSGKGKYTDNSARNDIVRVAVSHDGKAVRFRITTASKVSHYQKGDSTWMNILIQVSDTTGKAFPYDFVIGRHPSPKTGKTSVERISANGLMYAGEATYSVKGKEMTVSVPLEAIRISPEVVHFRFKVADHISRPFDIMDYYISGDSAPIGRTGYEYGRRNVLYSRLLDDGEPFNEYSFEGGVSALATAEGMTINGAGGQVRLDKYYSLGERTVRYEVSFSPDAEAFFRTDSGDFGMYVDVPGKRISIGNSSTGPAGVTSEAVPFLDPSHLYLIEISHQYLVNTARLTDMTSGKSAVLSLESDGSGGYGRGALQNGFSSGFMWDYYCHGLSEGSSLSVRKVEVASVEDEVFLMLYGDSITQPDGYFPKKDFPDSWTMRIMSNTRGKAVCSGRGGCTINEVLKRIPNELPFIKPRYVMVTIGTNGGNTEENLSRLIEYIFSQGSIPILNNVPCNESGTQVEINRLIAKVREKYGLKGCLFDLATSLGGDGLEVDKSMMFWEDFPPEMFNGWQVWHHPNAKGGEAMYLRSRQDVPELYR